ncbi:hypothetical protein THMIRHAS_04320 [Thiosulfatimonas sediminis]|uniref:Uncharacterized protein n=1 Tax=Thiosulfatimonas sediminis TaxID=2675054 RepID=A0A6F8PSH4_9GAMM|nr:hypothetical protein [Thiosulfatimonas sediminis]BBP45059.1 hypothetical protein THMIRHAS_04320 [Thiosulfatimonas sediminis]
MKSRLKSSLHAALFATLLSSSAAQAYLLPCQLVTQMAGTEIYEAQLQRVASLLAPQDLPAELDLALLQRHGGWYIYHTPQVWFSKQTCGPLDKTFNDKHYAFMPVLLNKKTGNNAVLTGTFVLRTYRPEHLQEVIDRYGFKMVTRLPKDDMAIIDVKPIQSYDDMIEALDKDRDVDLIAPIMSEPRFRPR